MEYDEYMEVIKLEDADLDEAAEASLKQELVANVIAEKYGLKPSEQDFQKALEEYAKQYKFASVELLLKAVSEEDMRQMVIQNNVKSWLTDRCKYVESSGESDRSEDADDAAAADDAKEAEDSSNDEAEAGSSVKETGDEAEAGSSVEAAGDKKEADSSESSDK